MTEIPIACTLTADGMTARLALIDALAADGLLDRIPTKAGLRVRLRDTPEIERRTRELIAAESRCCAFLDFALVREDGALLLDIAGPADARPVIEMYFAPRGPEPREPPIAFRGELGLPAHIAERGGPRHVAQEAQPGGRVQRAEHARDAALTEHAQMPTSGSRPRR